MTFQHVFYRSTAHEDRARVVHISANGSLSPGSSQLASSSPASIAALIESSRLAADVLRGSGLPQPAASVQTAANFVDKFNYSSLAAKLAELSTRTASHQGAADGNRVHPRPACFTFSEFAARVRAASTSTRSLPITSVESYEKSSNTGPLRIGHQYVVVTVLHPGGPTYARFDMFLVSDKPEIVWEGPSLFRVKMSDDKAALSRGRRLLSMVSIGQGQSVATGPSLDALAALVDIIEQRAGREFGLVGRNCAWMNELLTFGMARKFSSHWLSSGQYFPQETMRRWMLGEIGVLSATTDCTHPDPVGRWLAKTSGSVVRGLHVLLTQHDQDPFLMQDDEMAVVISAWTGYLPARAEEPPSDRTRPAAANRDGSPGMLRRMWDGLVWSYIWWRIGRSMAKAAKERQRKDRAAQRAGVQSRR
ncbi:hypothetical protein C8T65DRAFT_62539 [Cerioporus squamosus]|nr:hypothetical protein C8T65DRAFT_62539 [Cerioporus squamosus]